MSEKSVYDFCGSAFFFKANTVFVHLLNNTFVCIMRSRDFRWPEEEKLQLTHYYDSDARITIQDHNRGIYTAHVVGKNHKKIMKNYLLRLQGCDLLTDVEENDYRVKFKLTSKAKANLLGSFQAVADLCPGTIVW